MYKGLYKTDRQIRRRRIEAVEYSSGKKTTLTNKEDFHFTEVRSMDSLLHATKYIDYHYLRGHFKS